MLHIEYRISEDDFVAAAKLAINARRAAGLLRYYLLAGIGALSAVAGLWLAVTDGLPSAIVPLAWGVLLIWLPLRVVPAFRRQYRRMPTLQEPRCLEIDDNELHFTSPDQDSRNSWRLYSLFAENETTFVLLQQGNLMFIPIPKRDLAPAEVDALRAVLSAHLRRK